MDKLNLPGYIKSFASAMEDKEHENYNSTYHRIQQFSEQLALWAKSAQHQHVGLDDVDKLLQLGDFLQKELSHLRSEHNRRKNLELLLPSPNTQHHLPCSSLLSPTSPTPSSPTAQQSIAMSTNASSSSPGSVVPQSPTGSISPHGLVDSSMSITSTGVMQSDEYWRNRKMDPTKIVRRSPTPLYVNLTEQMILAQSSKRKRPAEGDLYCHNCKTKDTPEWRRGPMGAKTLCNACGIRWRLSQAEAAKQKKGEQLSPTQTPQLQYPMGMGLPSPTSSPQSPSTSPTQVPTQLQVSQSLQLQQQQQQLARQQQVQQYQQQQQLQQQLQHQYNQAHTHHQPPHPQQQHMVVPGPVGLAQENIPNGRMSLPSESTNGSSRNTGTPNGPVLSSLSALTPIAT